MHFNDLFFQFSAVRKNATTHSKILSNVKPTQIFFGEELLTAAIIILKFNKVMKGHLVLLKNQLDSGIVGSVPVEKTFFAGKTIFVFP